jgi:rhamnulose-1-phosphate aldolase
MRKKMKSKKSLFACRCFSILFRLPFYHQKVSMKALRITNEVQQKVNELTAVAQLLWERGWAESNAGNISIDISGTLKPNASGIKRFPRRALTKQYPELANAQFLITRAGTRMRDVATQPEITLTIIEINEDGTSFSMLRGDTEDGNLLPTSELATHLAIYQNRRKQGKAVNAIVHTHPTEIIALTHFQELLDEHALNTTLWKIYPEALIANPDGIGLIPYILTGTEALAQATVSSLRHHPAAMWEKHGCIAAAETVSKAFDLIDAANKAAQIYLLCRNAGIVPTGLTDEQLEELRRTFGSAL